MSAAEFCAKKGLKITDEKKQQIDGYLKVFHKFDKDENGTLSKDELKSLLDTNPNPPDLKNVLCLADCDRDGKISKEEFLSCLVGVSKEEQYGYAFRSFDKDGSGKIEAKEALAIIMREESTQNIEAAKRWIKEMDKDGDGMLDINEFTTYYARKISK